MSSQVTQAAGTSGALEADGMPGDRKLRPQTQRLASVFDLEGNLPERL